MLHLLQQIWPAGLVAGALGAVFAGFGGGGRGSPSSLPAVRAGALAAVAVGLVSVLAGFVPGRVGLWLEIATALAAFYALGSLAAAAIRDRLIK